jgi:hypothetical protein
VWIVFGDRGFYYLRGRRLNGTRDQLDPSRAQHGLFDSYIGPRMIGKNNFESSNCHKRIPIAAETCMVVTNELPLQRDRRVNT